MYWCLDSEHWNTNLNHFYWSYLLEKSWDRLRAISGSTCVRAFQSRLILLWAHTPKTRRPTMASAEPVAYQHSGAPDPDDDWNIFGADDDSTIVSKEIVSRSNFWCRTVTMKIKARFVHKIAFRPIDNYFRHDIDRRLSCKSMIRLITSWRGDRGCWSSEAKLWFWFFATLESLTDFSLSSVLRHTSVLWHSLMRLFMEVIHLVQSQTSKETSGSCKSAQVHQYTWYSAIRGSLLVEGEISCSPSINRSLRSPTTDSKAFFLSHQWKYKEQWQ